MTAYNVGDSNMFAYCANNPVMRGDAEGEFWHIVAGAVVGATISFVASVISDVSAGNKVDLSGAFISAAFGAASGALAATGFGIGAQIVGGSLIAGAENACLQANDKGWENVDYGEVAVSAAIGGITSRGNGLTRSTARHLNVQGRNATSRIVSHIKNNGIRGTRGVIRSSSKYYYSQTSTLFYTSLKKSARAGLYNATRSGMLRSLVITVS